MRLESTLNDFFHRYQAAVTTSSPVVPIMTPPEEAEDDEEPTVFRDKEMKPEDWKPIIVTEAPTREGESTLHFICIADLLSQIDYKEVEREKVKLPKRSRKGEYNDQETLEHRKFVKVRY